MTVAMLFKVAVVGYGVMLGAGFLYLRFHPETASRTLFEWGSRMTVVAGTLAPAGGLDRSWLRDVAVELLGPGFGNRLTMIAGETRDEVEAMAQATLDRARADRLAVASRELELLDRRLTVAEAAIVAAAANLAPSASIALPAAAPQPQREEDPAMDPAVRAAAGRLQESRQALDAAETALKERAKSFLAERRRQQAEEQLKVQLRKLDAAEGGGLEITVENGGPYAVTSLALSAPMGERAQALIEAGDQPGSAERVLRLTPEIVNEYNEKIKGLPPRFSWRIRIPLAPELEGGAGAPVAQLRDAELAPADKLERASPYGSGMRIWSYPQTSASELFADDLREAAARFEEAAAVNAAEQEVAHAKAALDEARAAVRERTERARQYVAWPRPEAVEAEPETDALEAAERLAAAQAERDRLAAEREAIQTRIDAIRNGTAGDVVAASPQAHEESLTQRLAEVKAALGRKIAAAREDARLRATRSDATGAFRFEDLQPGTYFIYSALGDPAAPIHYLQRIELREDGRAGFDAPVVMTAEEFLHGIVEAGT